MNPDDPARRARQKRILSLVGLVLIAAGLIVMLLLDRMPRPMRLLVGLTDVVAGLVLLVAARQVPAGRGPGKQP